MVPRGHPASTEGIVTYETPFEEILKWERRGEEAAAQIATLRAAGYSFEEILEIEAVQTDRLDPARIYARLTEIPLQIAVCDCGHTHRKELCPWCERYPYRMVEMTVTPVSALAHLLGANR